MARLKERSCLQFGWEHKLMKLFLRPGTRTLLQFKEKVCSASDQKFMFRRNYGISELT
uniref:Uncharacterized protein n=1 Tax=Rhizophora mucronata TaxID=61149 RepID=A0A2P2IXB2_RHIMU